MEVVADLRERVLRRLPREVAQLVDTAALDRDLGPREPDGAPQPGVTVDDRSTACNPRRRDRRGTLPRRERSPAHAPGRELFAPSTRTRRAQPRDADDLPPLRTRRANHRGRRNHVEVGERACPPRLQPPFSVAMTRDTGSSRGVRPQQRLEGAANRRVCLPPDTWRSPLRKFRDAP